MNPSSSGELSATDQLWTASFSTILIGQTLVGIGFSTFLVLPTFLATELDASAWEIGLITSLFGVSSMIFMPLAGHWADRTRRLPWALLGTVIIAASALGFCWIDEISLPIYSLRFLHGIGSGLEMVAIGALVTDLAPPSRLGQALGYYGLTMLASNAIAPVLAEWVSGRWGWSPVFALAAGASILGLFAFVTVREPAHTRQSEPSVSLARVAFRSRSLWFMAVVFLIGTSFAALFTFIQPFAIELGAREVSTFFIGYTATAVVVRLFFGSLADRFGKAPVSLLSLALYTVPVALSAHLQLSWLPWLGAVLGIAHGVLYPSFNALVIEPVASRERARVFALFMAAFNAGWAGGSLSLGAIAERAGYPAVFWAATAGLLLAIAIFMIPREVRRQLRFSPV